MKAFVKVNISIHFEGTGLEDGTKYPLQVQRAGLVMVGDVEEGKRVIDALSNHVNSTFVQMGVKVLPPGQHKPDLALAFGGDPEPKPEVV